MRTDLIMISKMAWRNIWRHKTRSLIIMLSISLGLFSGIAVLSLYKGMMKSRIRTTIDAETGHIQIHNTAFKKDYEPRCVIMNGDSIYHQMKKWKALKSLSKRSVTYGMLSTPTGSAGVQINGVDLVEECAVSQLDKKTMEGRLLSVQKKNEMMVGKKLAEKLKIKTGSRLVLTCTDSSGEIVSAAFRVAGIYRSANAPMDERNVYVGRRQLNTMLGIGDSFHELVMILRNDEDLIGVYDSCKKNFPSYSVESWKEIAPETELMVNTTDTLSYILISIIMFALAFGIINTMLMAVLERTREMGMMIALGTGKMFLFTLVLLETIFLTLAGTPIGVAVAWLVTNHFNRNGLDLSGMGKEMMSSFGYSTLIYPEFPADKFGGVMMIVIATSLLSGLFPAIKALRLSAIEALKK